MQTLVFSSEFNLYQGIAGLDPIASLYKILENSKSKGENYFSDYLRNLSDKQTINLEWFAEIYEKVAHKLYEHQEKAITAFVDIPKTGVEIARILLAYKDFRDHPNPHTSQVFIDRFGAFIAKYNSAEDISVSMQVPPNQLSRLEEINKLESELFVDLQVNGLSLDSKKMDKMLKGISIKKAEKLLGYLESLRTHTLVQRGTHIGFAYDLFDRIKTCLSSKGVSFQDDLSLFGTAEQGATHQFITKVESYFSKTSQNNAFEVWNSLKKVILERFQHN